MERLTRKFENGHIEMASGYSIRVFFNRLAAYEDTGLTPEQIQAQQQEIERLKKFIEIVQIDRDMEAVRVNALTADKDEQAGRIMQLESERDAAIEELDNAQPCFACAGFDRNGGKCWGAGTCRIRDIAALKDLEYVDHANGETWRWRGLLGGAEDETDPV